jgi:threonine dehydratase
VAKLVDDYGHDEDISRAPLLLKERGKLVAERPAVGVAALPAGAVSVEPPVVVVPSGGNIDPLLCCA